MKSQEFCYWLQGWLEMTGATEMTARQLEIMKKHLEMVFIHEIDPQYPEKTKLDAAHSSLPAHLHPGGPTKLRC
jgi:hypothetical protein